MLRLIIAPSSSVKARVVALEWVCNLPDLLEYVLQQGEIQDGGFRCPAHLVQQYEALLTSQMTEEVTTDPLVQEHQDREISIAERIAAASQKRRENAIQRIVNIRDSQQVLAQRF